VSEVQEESIIITARVLQHISPSVPTLYSVWRTTRCTLRVIKQGEVEGWGGVKLISVNELIGWKMDKMY